MRAVEVDLLVRRIAAASSSNLRRTVNLIKLLGAVCEQSGLPRTFRSDFMEGGEYDRHGFQKIMEEYQALLGVSMSGTFDRFFDEIIEEHIKRRNRREEGEEQKFLVDALLDIQKALLIHLPGQRLPCLACGEVLSKPHLLDYHQTTHHCSAYGIVRHGFVGKQTDLDGITTYATVGPCT